MEDHRVKSIHAAFEDSAQDPKTNFKSLILKLCENKNVRLTFGRNKLIESLLEMKSILAKQIYDI